MKISKLDKINLPASQPDEWWDYKIYFVFSLILGLTSWLGFYVQPTIYHGAAAAWHSIPMLTDVHTCALPLFNWGLALASLANFFLFVFTWFRPGVLGRKAFIVVSLLTVLALCGYIVNLLVAYAMTAELLSP